MKFLETLEIHNSRLESIPKSIGKLSNFKILSLANYDYDKTIYYGVGILSFVAVLNLMISVWQLINKGGKDSKKSIITLIRGLGLGILSGFTTCLPLFL